MNETLQKWSDEFNIHNPESEPLLFLLLKDYYECFNSHKSNHILDEQNRLLIDERVAEKSSILQNKIEIKIQELSDLTDEFKHVNITCNKLHDELNSLKENKNSEIEKAVNQSVSANASANAEFIQHLKEQIDSLKEEIDSLKEERNIILSDFVKDNTCSSYESGVIGETEMLIILQSGPWDEVIATNKKDHSGDFMIRYKGNKYIIDVKNYSDNVPGNEVRKLAKDIDTNSCDGGAIISLKSGIYNPNTNMITKDNIHHITVSGKKTLLLSNASSLNKDFINSILLSLYCETTSENNTMVTENCKREIVISIKKMERELDSEKKSFQQKITRKQNDLDNLKNTLKEIINGFDELSDDDSPKPQSKSKVTAKGMRKKLLENGYNEESKLKGNELKSKYNELIHD
ncbi:MAG: hypothetical protein O3C01_07695 [Bacteroidetes bacterium]|nr:hypothetical protein [Bacteroidota bacterium]